MNNIINTLRKSILATGNVQQTTAVKPVSSNPFNPFVTTQENTMNNYAKNKPVRGGYFAGYYNGQANIVGQRLFIEV